MRDWFRRSQRTCACVSEARCTLKVRLPISETIMSLASRRWTVRRAILLAQQQVQETGKERVLDGLSRAAGRLRETLGESISSVRKFDTPLAQATTPSLEALRALSMGRDALADGNYAGAVSWFSARDCH